MVAAAVPLSAVAPVAEAEASAASLVSAAAAPADAAAVPSAGPSFEAGRSAAAAVSSAEVSSDAVPAAAAPASAAPAAAADALPDFAVEVDGRSTWLIPAVGMSACAAFDCALEIFAVVSFAESPWAADDFRPGMGIAVVGASGLAGSAARSS
ncbi:hypothetical protein [Nocardia rhizosphaerihabitans]|uniref:hypothetical protein n=1 Tax=Nocardia rhizosphaerihabitans TaxID=1691570 RepID=UPI001E3EF905|nr:hypothetical protein [Nocardia rhizosphaerihabitans]